MKHVSLLLEDDEIFILRLSVRMFEFLAPEQNDQLEQYKEKILKATSEIGGDYRKEIGKMQRAMRRIRESPEFAELQLHIKILEKMLAHEMSKEEYLPPE